MQFEIPHELGRAEAKRRIDKSLPALEKHIPGGASVATVWTSDDTLDMKIGALGQTIRVRLDVEDTRVRGDVAVPLMLSMMSGVIADFIEKNSRKMLEAGGKSKSKPAEA